MEAADSTKQNTPRARARTARQLERQERVFVRSVVDGLPYRAIAAELGVCLSTIVKDIRHEEERRAEELGERREVEKARAIAIYERVILEGLRLARKADESVEYGGDGAGPAGVAAPFASLARGLDSAVRARERIDKILGVDVPTKVDSAMEKLLQALDGKYDD
jgi:hypothetical protein